MTLYEITEDITKESEEAVTIKEASKRLNRTVGSLYGAAAEGRRINDRYYLMRMQRIIKWKLFDGLTWQQVARKLGPKATENSVKKEFERFLRKK